MNNKELNIEKGRRLKECILKKYSSSRQFTIDISERGLYSLNPGNLSKMQSGERAITRDFAHVVAPLLDVSEHYLMCETDIKELLPWNNETLYSDDDILVFHVVRLLETRLNNSISFYVLPHFTNPPKAPLNDLISKHRKEVSPEHQKDNAFILRHILFDVPLFPSDRAELSELSPLYAHASKEEQSSMLYKNWSHVRKKVTIDNLSGFTTLDNSCIYKDNNSQSEVDIECVAINERLLPFSQFIALVYMCSNMVLSLFDSSACLDIAERLSTLSP